MGGIITGKEKITKHKVYEGGTVDTGNLYLYVIFN